MQSILKALEAAERKPSKLALPEDTQRVCIDLPGEDIRCHIYMPKLQIMLRKHRDVIFEIALFKGMTYTVEADQSDFYNARDKKLVEFKKKHKVSFADGERMHLWVARQFKGSLLLKANGKVMGRYEPGALDNTRYDDDPATKPAPLIVVLKNEPDQTAASSPGPQASAMQCTADDPLGIGRTWMLSPVASAYGLDFLAPMSRSTAVVVEAQHATVVVIDASEKGMPQKLLDHFASGGGKSGLADVDSNEVATRNWLYGQLAGATAYAGDNWNWLQHSVNRQADGAFKLVKAQVSYVRGKVRIYFSGYSRMNPVFGPGGHGPGNAKVLQIYSGVGNSASTFTSAAKGIAGTFKGNALVSFVFGSAASWSEWQADAQKDGYDLAAALLMGLLKALVVAALTVAAVAALITFLMAGLVTSVAALAVGVVTILVGLVTNFAVEAVDKRAGKAWKGTDNSDGLAAGMAPFLRSTGTWLSENWQHLMSKMPKDYGALTFE